MINKKPLSKKREVLKIFLRNLEIPQNQIRMIVELVKDQDKEAVDKLKEETKKVINTIPTDGGFKLILFGKFMDKFDNIFGRFE